MSGCQCVYDQEQHPECAGTPTALVAVSSEIAVPMCQWCATDWNRRHPDMDVVFA